MNGLFGLELPTPVNFVIAFVVVLALIGAATWLVRRFGATRLEAAGRNRQPRLAVIDATAVDGRRKLVIIRRDNVEHLLMIGGPTDVVVETNIVRAGAAVPRDAPAARVNGGETLPRAMPLPDATHWPTQPEPAAPAPAPAPPERLRPDETAQWPAPPEPTPLAPPPPAPTTTTRPQRTDAALAGLAADLSQPAAMPPPQPRAPQAPPVRVAAAKLAPAAQADPQAAVATDANLASMAHQLEAALSRPVHAEAPKPAETQRIEPKLAPPPRPAPAAKPPAAAAAAAAAPTVPTPQKQPFESIEQEMANLLGRSGKT